MLKDAELEEVCEQIGVDVTNELKGKRKLLFKSVIKYFCELDDDEAAFKSVYDFLVAKEDKKNIPALDNTAAEEKSVTKNAPKKEPIGTVVDVMKLKDFKISGTIGGDKKGKDVLTFDSLLYQVDNAKKTFPDHAICAAIIKAIAPGNNLRSYLESSPDMTLDDFMEFLKSHFHKKDSASYFVVANFVLHL